MAFGSQTTRMPLGVTNAAPWQTFGAAGALDPTYYHMYANDFDRFDAPLPAPVQAAGAANATGGTLPAATNYYYKVTAIGQFGETMGSNEIMITSAGGAGVNSNTVNWALVPGAASYRVYRGTAAGAENVYFAVTGNNTSFTDTGAAGTAGSPPATNLSGPEWAQTLVGTGTAALQPGYDGGGSALSTSAGATDATYMQLVQAGFKLVAGKEVFFKWAGQLPAGSDANCTLYMGLIAKTATPLAGNPDGVFIRKVANGNLQLVAAQGGVSVVTDLGISPALSTDFEVGFHIDVQGNVEIFYNPTTGNNPISPANAAAGQSRGRIAAVYAPALPASVLALSLGILNNSAAARTLVTDYIVAARAR